MDILKLLSQSLRGAIIAPPGKLLFVADYASIEARVLLWCAQDEAGLTKFRNGVDLYCDMAGAIYNRTITKENAAERQLGKIAILGLGYQMGAPKFHATCAQQGIDIAEELAVRTVAAYRDKYHRVKSLWYDQETAAGEAAMCKHGEVFECFPVKWWREDRFLYCQLPSGRKLAYPDAKVSVITTYECPTCNKRLTTTGRPVTPMCPKCNSQTMFRWTKNTLTYMGVNAMTRKWMRQSVYGGLIVENLVQAISRDVMAEAMVRLEDTGIYQPILTVHDECIAEAHKDHGNVEDFTALVGQCPIWAKGCPIAAEGWAGTRYRK